MMARMTRELICLDCETVMAQVPPMAVEVSIVYMSDTHTGWVSKQYDFLKCVGILYTFIHY